MIFKELSMKQITKCFLEGESLTLRSIATISQQFTYTLLHKIKFSEKSGIILFYLI